MIRLIKWWLTWTFRGLKLAFLLAAGLAAAGAAYMGWQWISIVHPGFELEPRSARIFGMAWQVLGHSVQLALFASVVVNWFPDFFRVELAGIAERDQEEQ